VPNADFLGGAVTNWTHKDQAARLHLDFRTPGSLGAEGGRDLLLACAAGHAEVQKAPAPSVLLKEIGDGYGFELVVDIDNAEHMDEVASDLRFAVDKALRLLPA
jgi:small-conductance mechanosensitive channel